MQAAALPGLEPLTAVVPAAAVAMIAELPPDTFEPQLNPAIAVAAAAAATPPILFWGRIFLSNMRRLEEERQRAEEEQRRQAEREVRTRTAGSSHGCGAEAVAPAVSKRARKVRMLASCVSKHCACGWCRS